MTTVPSHRVRALTLLLLGLALLLLTLPASRVIAQEEEPIPVEEAAQGLEPRVIRSWREGEAIRTIVEIPASQDTFVSSNQPDTNFNGDNNLRIGYSRDNANLGAVRSLAQFNIATIPANSTVNSAVIRFYQHTATPPDDAPMLVRIRHLDSAWNAASVTWNSHTPNWGDVVLEANVTVLTGWKEAPITGQVRQWYNGTHPNYGLFIQGDETPRERQRIGYQVNANNGLYPRIVVDYSTTIDNTPPTATTEPLPAWSAPTFVVRWHGEDNTGGSGIAYYDIQFNSNGGSWLDWKLNRTDDSEQFNGGQHGVTYQFRARAVDRAGNVGVYGNAQSQTTVDGIAPTASVNSLPNWSGSSFVVQWGGNDPGGGIAHYDVEFNVNGGAWQLWRDNTTATSATFTGGLTNNTYQFRARATDIVGNEQPFGGSQAQTTIDGTAPQVSVHPLPPISTNTTFYVTWGGSDNGSGISRYDVQYRVQGQAWNNWQIGTTSTLASFTGVDGRTYEFRARGIDNAGNVQAYGGAQAVTTIVAHPVATVNQPDPGYTREASITLTWAGTTAPGTTIEAYDIRVRRDGGAWQHWLTTQSNTALFEFTVGVDALYEFEAIATNSLGQREPVTGLPEAFIYSDQVAPFMAPTVWMPLMQRAP